MTGLDTDYKTLYGFCNFGDYDSFTKYENIDHISEECIYYLLKCMFYKCQDIEMWMCEDDNSDENTQNSFRSRIAGIEKCRDFLRNKFNIDDVTYEIITMGNKIRQTYIDFCKEVKK